MEVQKKTEVSAMKKLFSLVLVLCLLCAGAALAETVTKETTLELEGFTLTLNPGEMYELVTEAAETGQPYLTVYPFAGENDYATNYNISSVNVPEGYNAEQMKKEIVGVEEQFRAAMEASDVRLEAFEIKDPCDGTLGEAPCTSYDYSATIKLGTTSVSLFARSIIAGSINANFIITAGTEEALEKVAQRLTEALHFQ